MIKNYLKIALRSLLKQKGYSFINLTGLAIGMTCCVILILFIQYELSYDKFHKNADRIYRVISEHESEGRIVHSLKTPVPYAPALIQDFPEVENAVRFSRNMYLVTHGNKRFYEQIYFADPEIFDVFSFPLIRGNPRSALEGSQSLLVSEKVCEKYFGDEDPIGKVLTLYDQDHTVSGVFKDIPQNSHLRFDFLGSFFKHAQRHAQEWGISNYYTYVLTEEGFDRSAFEEKLPDFIEKYRGEEVRHVYKYSIRLQPITRIHLHSELSGEISPNTDIRTITIFTAIAVFILLIACFNYINLSTARCVNRAKEVGLRKVIGASRIQLIKQFLGESFLLSFMALLLTFVLVEFLLPVFNSLSGKDLSLDYSDNILLLVFLLSIFFFVGLFSGSFLAFYVSAFQPVRALKGVFSAASKVSLLRRSLVISQFALSIVFIVATFVIFNQLKYMRNENLGFEKDNVLMVPIYEQEVMRKGETIKREWTKNEKVISACLTSFFPGKNQWYQNYWHEGASEDSYLMMNWIAVDHDFLDTFQVELTLGRNFLESSPNDARGGYILNEAAVEEIGWEDPIGKQFRIIGDGAVIGVVKDFHFTSLHQKIVPMAMFMYPSGFEYFSVRIRPYGVQDTLNFLRAKWTELTSSQYFEYSFLDEDYDNLYRTEMRLSKILGTVTFLSIFIACLGLFGLASFMVERRTKEIGIRKVLGAPLSKIMLILTREFALWVLAANIIAWPVAYYFMFRWLQNFAYRIPINLWVFLFSGASALGIAFLTVSYQAIRATLADPVKTLRYE